ncbi:MAG: methyltransferase domain-containing protein [Nitrospira sp.]
MLQEDKIELDPEDRLELDRLRALEAALDPATQECLLSTGLAKGWRCLEVGAGAGSVLSWMTSIVGPAGSTTAIDLDTRFLGNTSPGTDIIHGDIRTHVMQAESFHLVHARYVLVHLPDYEVALARMLETVRPGGWLVVEEPHSSAARAISGGKEDMASVEKMNRAIRRIFMNAGKDYDLGIRFPSLFQAARLRNIRVEYDAPASQGTSAIADMMRICAAQAKQRYIDTGEATEQDVDNYCRFAQDPNSWAIYYATVRVMGQK